MKFFYMYGNIGTHKSTYARYIADRQGTLILDDDELYHVLCNKSWKFYYNKGIQEVVLQMFQGAVSKLQENAVKDAVVATASLDPFMFSLDIKPPNQLFIIVTGNGTREFSLENRRKNHRGVSQEEWAMVYDQEAAKIRTGLASLKETLEDKTWLAETVLWLTDPLDEELSKKEIDKFLDNVYNVQN